MSSSTTGQQSQEFLKLYDDFSDAIFRHCYYRVFDRERAKDLVQETFLRVWQYVQDDKEVRNMKAFLYRVANNLIIDESRKKRMLSLDALQEEGFDPQGSSDREITATVDANAVLHVVDQLDANYREVFVMRYVNGLPPREIADILEESPNVISVRLHRAVQAIRDRLQL